MPIPIPNIRYMQLNQPADKDYICAKDGCLSTNILVLLGMSLSSDESLTLFLRCNKCTHWWKI